jgi:hypothetical protein
MILFIATWFTGAVRLNDLQWLIVDVGCWHHVELLLMLWRDVLPPALVLK